MKVAHKNLVRCATYSTVDWDVRWRRFCLVSGTTAQQIMNLRLTVLVRM